MTASPPVRCLVVDDEAPLRQVLVRLLRGQGHVCREAASGREALELLAQEPADLVLSDIHMPEMDGTALLAEVRKRWPDTGVVMVTAVTEVRTAVSCLNQGALDYLGKPFQVEEAVARVRQALEKRRLILENRDYQLNLETKVRQQALRIEELFVEGVQALAHALEAKDPYTRGHSARVSAYAAAAAAAMGLDADLVGEVKLGGELHDIGKIGVRESVLHKPGRLDHQEYLHIMEHPIIGERILAPLVKEHPLVLEIVRSHHERPDGLGLPDRLKGDAIPPVARITAVADTFDAMTSARPYRTARPVEAAIAELRACAGTQFDAEAVAAFLRAFPDPARLPMQTPIEVGALHEAALAALAR
ncbi:MAG: response regulator [Gemmatimonadetes bacterium]|nr:response regulator [Gemmatimonadota bacterium]